MFFETCVQELKERKDTDVVTVAAAATGGAGDRSGGFGSEIVVNGRQCLDDLSVSPKGAPLWTSDSACGSPLLIHQAVASMARREKLQMQQQQRIEHAQLQHHEALMMSSLIADRHYRYQQSVTEASPVFDGLLCRYASQFHHCSRSQCGRMYARSQCGRMYGVEQS